jgi:RHS repeat-associated protein
VKENNTPIAAYTYDANGNRLSFTAVGGEVTASYDNRDRLLQYGDATFTYTEQGELLSKSSNGQTAQYAYDALGNLTAVTLADDTQIDYLIDGKNRRVGRSVDGLLQQMFLYQDGFQLVAELDGSGNVVSRFVYGTQAHVPDYMERNGVRYRIVTDQLGSVRMVVNAANGAIEQRIDYDAFGRVLQDTNPGFQPFGFAGGLYDPLTGLTRFGVRDYDAEVGRWTSADPLNFAAGSANLYVYAENDPVNRIDPSGLLLPAILGGVAIGAVLADAAIATAIIAAGMLAADAISDLIEEGSITDLIDQIIEEISNLGEGDVSGTPWDNDPTRPDITRPIPLPVPDIDPNAIPNDPGEPSPWDPSGGGGTLGCE